MPKLLRIASAAAMVVVAGIGESSAESIRSFEWNGEAQYEKNGEFKSCYLAKTNDSARRDHERFAIVYIAGNADLSFEIKLAFDQKGVPIEKFDELFPGSKRPQARILIEPFGRSKERTLLKEVNTVARLYSTSSGALSDLYRKSYTADLFLYDVDYGLFSREFGYKVFLTISLSGDDPLLTKLALADGLMVSLSEPFGSNVSISFRHPSIRLPFARPKSDASEALAAVRECLSRHAAPKNDYPSNQKESSSSKDSMR